MKGSGFSLLQTMTATKAAISASMFLSFVSRICGQAPVQEALQDYDINLKTGMGLHG
jgi:hypothetical protein